MADTDNPVRWRTEVCLAFLPAIVPVAVALSYVIFCPWFQLVEDDAISLDQPVISDCFGQLYAGRLPWWSDHTGCGFPLAARTWMLLYPPHHAAFWAGKCLGLAGKDVLIAYPAHLGFGAFAAFLYLRHLAVRRMTAAAAAIAYGLTGPLLGLTRNWPDYAFWLPYVPLGFLTLERLAGGDRSWFWTCFAGLVGSMVFLCSNVVGLVKFGFLIGGYFLLQTGRGQMVFVLGRLAVAALLILLCCAGPMAANYQYLRLTSRLPDEGLYNFEGLYLMTTYPEFYRGFFFPLSEYVWKVGFNRFLFEDYVGRFHGSGVYAGPLAPLGACLAVALFANKGAHRVLLVLLGTYCLLSLGIFWGGNQLLFHLPFFRQYRWPVRWTPEFCAVAALLGGVGVELGWRHWQQRATRVAALVCLTFVFLAVTIRTGLSHDDEFMGHPTTSLWFLASAVLIFFFDKGRRRAFDLVALGFTVTALVAIAPGAQLHRWAEFKDLSNHPLPYGVGSQERVLFLATRNGIRRQGVEGCYAYNMPHVFGSRTVLTYGPFKLQNQEWAAGVDPLGEVIDEEQTVRAFFKGHLLETMRVGWVVVPVSDTILNKACREHPRLGLEAETPSLAVYRHDGFRAPAFSITELRPESDLLSLEELGKAELAHVAYVENGYAGPMDFEASGGVHEFVEDNGSISFRTDAPGDRFVVVTTTWYPDWQARVDGDPVPLFRVNGSFMGLTVPAGRHEVKLEYRPTRIAALFAVNLVALVSLISYSAVHGFRRLYREGERSARSGKGP